MIGSVARLFFSLTALVAVLVGLGYPIGPGFSLGHVFEPVDGLYRTAVLADTYRHERLSLDALTGEVRIIRDARGVPHIFADSDRDAVIALGYVTAQDRLFQIDFVARTASGRLAEVLGSDALSTDLFFRSIGLKWAADKNAKWLKSRGDEQADLIDWYQSGANAWIDSLAPRDDPFEFRILGYRPKRLQMEDALGVLLYMSYDLSYTNKDAAYSQLRERLSSEDYDLLFPKQSGLSVPIVGESEMVARAELGDYGAFRGNLATSESTGGLVASVSEDHHVPTPEWDTLTEGIIPGKGSNNWAVAGSRSETGAPILAGDMHLNLSLPAIWYEAHLVTPSMNVYGVTIPGAPAIIEGITPSTAWAYTNTGSDQIDYYGLQMSGDGKGYILDGTYTPFGIEIDTVQVKGSAPVVDSLFLSRFGPVSVSDGAATAIKWAAHDTSRTMLAIWKMGHARNYDAFKSATRIWDSPMQNILFAARDGTIAIRSTGYLPVRESGGGAELLDGTNSSNDWSGRVPFDELPASVSPGKGFLTSTNQRPAGSWYPYYLGRDWRDAYRSMRIDRLLRSSPIHTVDDIKSYQSDVYAVQADLFLPLIDSVDGLSERARDIRNRLMSWDRRMTLEQLEPLLFDRLLSELSELVWDEETFKQIRTPAEMTLYRFLSEFPEAAWIDRPETPERETANSILIQALEKVAALYGERIAENDSSMSWGSSHSLIIRHLTRSTGFRPLWRGPYPYPGYKQTLSPAGGETTTHSASWRVVVDFSSSPPAAYGVYPGGQSGNPFSRRYDNQIETYLNFEYFSLLLPDSPSALSVSERSHELVLVPGSPR